jgi:hypothetical protein
LAIAACSASSGDKEQPKSLPTLDAGAKPASPAEALPAIAEKEPNDTPQTAQLIEGPERISGDLHPIQPASHPDEDWYKVQPKTLPRDLHAELSGFSGRIGLEVYDRDLNKLLTLGSEAGQSCLLPSYRIKDALYLRVFSPTGTTGPYSLALVMKAPDPNSESEPNDRPMDATLLPLDHPMSGTIGTPTDEDWYRVDLVPPATPPAPGQAPAPAPTPTAPPNAPSSPTPTPPAPPTPTAAPPAAPNPALAAPADAGFPIPLPGDANPEALLQIKLTGIPDLRLQIHLFDQDQRPLGELESHMPGEGIDMRDFGLMPRVKSVYLVVQSGSMHGKRLAAPSTPYTLSVHREVAPPNFEIEPNDSVDTATPIGGGKRVGYLSPKGDVDYFVVHMATPSLLHAHLSGLDHVDTELSVVDRPTKAKERDKLVFRINEGGAKEPEVIPSVALAPGDHFVKVEAAAHQVGAHWLRDQENPTDTYELDVTLSPDDGNFEREPNNTPAEAMTLKVGQSVKGYAYPAKDVDFYRLDLSTQPVGSAVVIKLEGVAKVPISLQLRGPVSPDNAKSEGALINTSDHGKPGTDEEIRAKLDPGIYLMEVKPAPTVKVAGQPGGDPDDPYTLTVQGE